MPYSYQLREKTISTIDEKQTIRAIQLNTALESEL